MRCIKLLLAFLWLVITQTAIYQVAINTFHLLLHEDFHLMGFMLYNNLNPREQILQR